MPLRKSPMTPARLESNRRNANKSNRPRRRGSCLCLDRDPLLALAGAPPAVAAETAQVDLPPANARHPLLAVDMFLLENTCVNYERSHYVYENKGALSKNELSNLSKTNSCGCRMTTLEALGGAFCVVPQGRMAMRRYVAVLKRAEERRTAGKRVH